MVTGGGGGCVLSVCTDREGEEAASSAARRMCKRKVDMSSCGPTSMVIAEAPSFVVCVLTVCTDRCVGSGFGCMAAAVSPKMGDAAVLELTTWVSPSGPVGMTPCVPFGLFVSPMVMSELVTWLSSFGPVGMVPCVLVGLFVSPMVMSV